jgi:NAD+ kinase
VTDGARAARVMTHRFPSETACAFDPLLAAACDAGYEVLLDPDETEKHDLEPRDGLVLNADPDRPVDVCIVLGGDGTILTALRRYAHSDVPVFAVNFGEVGFLATIEPGEMTEEFARAFAREFEVLSLPAVIVEGPNGRRTAINDLSIHRKVGERVANLAYIIEDEEVGSVRCDGVVVATPAGSTGYNLANGGPVLAWGVEGFVVSFIAPHSLTARALVVAPNDRLSLHNRSRHGVDVIVDGRPVWELAAGEAVDATFAHDVATLAQVPGSTFYHRLQDKFGRLSS